MRLSIDQERDDSSKWSDETVECARMRAFLLLSEAKPWLSEPAREVFAEADVRAWSRRSGGAIRITARWRGLKARSHLDRLDAAGGSWLARVFNSLAEDLQGAHLKG